MSATARRLRRSVTRTQIKTALAACGCICDHNIVHTGPGRIRVEHDDWCPMRYRGPQLILAFPKSPRCER